MCTDHNDHRRRKAACVRGDKAPQTYTTGAWPHDAVPEPDAPIGVHYSLALARTLDDLCVRRDLSHRALSIRAGITPNAVGRIVRGDLYPDLATIARLEHAAQESLFPHAHYRTIMRPSTPP